MIFWKSGGYTLVYSESNSRSYNKICWWVSQGCYVCRLDNHNYTTCTHLIDLRRLGIAAYDNNNTTTPNNSSSITNTGIEAETNNQGKST